MAAGKPRGATPERYGKNTDAETDVKPEETDASTDLEDVDTKEAAEDDVDLDESDLEALKPKKKEQKAVPYARFKEINEKLKKLEEQSAVNQFSKSDLDRAIEDAERRAAERFRAAQEAEEEESLPEEDRQQRALLRELQSLRDEVTSLKETGSQSALKSEIAELKKRYPNADELAVLGWKKVHTGKSVEELMKTSHERNSEFVQGQIEKILEEKRARRKRATIPTEPGSIRLKPEEKPKTMADAGRAVKEYMRRIGSL